MGPVNSDRHKSGYISKYFTYCDLGNHSNLVKRKFFLVLRRDFGRIVMSFVGNDIGVHPKKNS